MQKDQGIICDLGILIALKSELCVLSDFTVHVIEADY